MIHITYVCGHTTTIGETVNGSPVCACGERRIAMVDPRRMPRFTGTVTGPCAEFKALDAGTVDVAPGGPLTLKDRG